MRAGDVLNGYTLLADFTVVGAGLSRWTFARKGGREYFVKEFLSPTYPDVGRARAASGSRRRSGRAAPPSRSSTAPCRPRSLRCPLTAATSS